MQWNWQNREKKGKVHHIYYGKWEKIQENKHYEILNKGSKYGYEKCIKRNKKFKMSIDKMKVK